MAQVSQDDADARIEEGQFAQPVLERLEVELDHGEGRRGGQEGDLGAAAAVIGARRLSSARRCRSSASGASASPLVKAISKILPLRRIFSLQPDRQRIDDGHADAMQAARDLVGILVELAAGMELGHHHFGRRNALGRVHVGGNAAAIVDDGAGAIGVEGDGHQVGMAGQRLVDGVVDDLIDHVVQARAVIGVADIHAGALAHGVEALQDLDGIGAVFIEIRPVFRGRCGGAQRASESGSIAARPGLADWGRLPKGNGDFLPDFKAIALV